jgi:hypothetical protein
MTHVTYADGLRDGERMIAQVGADAARASLLRDDAPAYKAGFKEALELAGCCAWCHEPLERYGADMNDDHYHEHCVDAIRQIDEADRLYDMLVDEQVAGL